MGIDSLIDEMINEVKRKFNILGKEMPSNEILDAFRNVKRHYFTPRIYDEVWENKKKKIVEKVLDYNNPDPEILKEVYSDNALAILVKNNKVISTSSQPFVMAMMLQDGKIKKGNKALEVGTGSGYNAAIMANICGSQKNVVTIEINKKVAELAKKNLERAGFSDVTVINGDGGEGYSDNAPYDSVIITCGAPEIPKAIIEQTSEGGTLSLPLVTHGIETLCSLTKKDGIFEGYLSLPVRFLHFEGIYSDKMQFAKKIGSLQTIIEKHGEKERDIEDKFKDIFLNGNENKEEKHSKRIKRSNFEFFLAISRPNSILYEPTGEANKDYKEGHERGYGLWDIRNHGLVIMFNKEIISWGNEKVIDDFVESYKTWKNFGELSLSDYSLFFYPDSAPASGYGEWQVKRRTGTTAFKLKRRRPEQLLIDANY